MANLVHLTSSSKDTIWRIIRKIKMDASPENSEKYCNKYGLSLDIRPPVERLEQELNIVSSEKRYKNIALEDLKTAAEMLLFLNTCPYSLGNVDSIVQKWFKSWWSFYKDLFLTQTPYNIILTLNRMTKTRTSENGKLRAQKLLRKSARLLSLQFKEIQSFLPEKYIKNESGVNFKIPNGTCIYSLFTFIKHFSSLQILIAPSSNIQCIS